METRKTNRPKIRPNRVTRKTSTTIITTAATTTNAPYIEDFSSVADFERMAPGIAAIEDIGAMSQEARRLSQLISDEDLAAFQRVMTVLARNQMQIDPTQATHSRSGFRDISVVPAAPPRWSRTTEVPRTYSVKTSCKENSPCVYHVISDIYCMHNANPNNYFQCSPGPDGRGVWVERQCPGGLRFYENGECGLEIFQPDGKFGNEKSEIYSTSPNVPESPVKEPLTVGNEREIAQPVENRENVQGMISRTKSPIPIAGSVDLSGLTIDKFYPHFANAMQQQLINSNPIQPRIYRPQTNNSFPIDRQVQSAFGSFPMDYWKPSNMNPYSMVRPVVDNNDAFQRSTAMNQQMYPKAHN
uniref:Chitin-binding type-2 domain-containing protein n=1 Tax=Romanomermis culicivorax TaxID=13658 RepID=A0A915KD38_ROMCU